MATKDVRDRIVTLLETITLSGVVLTVAPVVPRNAAPYEGYVMYTQMSGSTVTRIAEGMVSELQTWLIRVWTPQLGLGWDAVREDNLYNLRDAVLAVFCKRSTLNNLASVMGSQVVSDRFATPSEFAENAQGLWECTLQVNIERRAGC
jgi:hypothetical protein